MCRCRWLCDSGLMKFVFVFCGKCVWWVSVGFSVVSLGVLIEGIIKMVCGLFIDIVLICSD